MDFDEPVLASGVWEKLYFQGVVQGARRVAISGALEQQRYEEQQKAEEEACTFQPKVNRDVVPSTTSGIHPGTRARGGGNTEEAGARKCVFNRLGADREKREERAAKVERQVQDQHETEKKMRRAASGPAVRRDSGMNPQIALANFKGGLRVREESRAKPQPRHLVVKHGGGARARSGGHNRPPDTAPPVAQRLHKDAAAKKKDSQKAQERLLMAKCPFKPTVVYQDPNGESQLQLQRREKRMAAMAKVAEDRRSRKSDEEQERKEELRRQKKLEEERRLRVNARLKENPAPPKLAYFEEEKRKKEHRDRQQQAAEALEKEKRAKSLERHKTTLNANNGASKEDQQMEHRHADVASRNSNRSTATTGHTPREPKRPPTTAPTPNSDFMRLRTPPRDASPPREVKFSPSPSPKRHSATQRSVKSPTSPQRASASRKQESPKRPPFRGGGTLSPRDVNAGPGHIGKKQAPTRTQQGGSPTRRNIQEHVIRNNQEQETIAKMRVRQAEQEARHVEAQLSALDPCPRAPMGILTPAVGSVPQPQNAPPLDRSAQLGADPGFFYPSNLPQTLPYSHKERCSPDPRPHESLSIAQSPSALEHDESDDVQPGLEDHQYNQEAGGQASVRPISFTTTAGGISLPVGVQQHQSGSVLVNGRELLVGWDGDEEDDVYDLPEEDSGTLGVAHW